jgi:hypothetical protein
MTENIQEIWENYRLPWRSLRAFDIQIAVKKLKLYLNFQNAKIIATM